MKLPWRRSAVRAACWLGLAAAAASVAAAAGAAEHRVLIDGMDFHPKVVRAHPGDTITWLNQDMFVHNVSVAAAHAASGDLSPGKRWRYTVPAAGSFDYVCTLHPVMKGRIEVLKK
jgi:plastocyanin